MSTEKARIRLAIPKPHKVQETILEGMRRFNVICAGRRTGKSALALIRASKFLIEGKRVAYFCPTFRMLSDFMRQATELFRPVLKHANKTEHRIELITGGVFDFWSLESFDTVRGRKYHHIIIDEAAMFYDLESAWSAALRPLLTDYSGSADFMSTPKGINYFHKLFQRASDPTAKDWAAFQFPTSANPYIVPSEIEAAREELPLDVFRQEYLAEFIQGDGSVFRNITPNLTSKRTKPADHENHRLVAGIDWGMSNDFTVCSIGCADCRTEVELDRFNQIDWSFQRERLKGLLEKWKVQDALVELNSIGGPNFEELQRAGLPVSGFQTTAQSKPRVIQNLALALEKEEVKLLDVPVATRELEAFEAKRSEATGRISYGAPSGANSHDDSVIARALMVEVMLNRGVGIWI
jgi:hypothetical protein